MLDQAVKGLLRRHAFVSVDCDGHVAEGERFADVYLPARDGELADNVLYVATTGLNN